MKFDIKGKKPQRPFSIQFTRPIPTVPAGLGTGGAYRDPVPSGIESVVGATADQVLGAGVQAGFGEDTMSQLDSRLGGEQTEIIGDEFEEEINQIQTNYVYDIKDTTIDENGFIDQLSFEFVASMGGNILQIARARADKNVFIEMDRYAAPSQQVILRDYHPVSNAEPPQFVESMNTYILDSTEIDGLKEILGGRPKNAIQITNDIKEIFGNSAARESDLIFEPSVVINKTQSEKKLILNSVTENLITAERRIALEEMSLPPTITRDFQREVEMNTAGSSTAGTLRPSTSEADDGSGYVTSQAMGDRITRASGATATPQSSTDSSISSRDPSRFQSRSKPDSSY